MARAPLSGIVSSVLGKIPPSRLVSPEIASFQDTDDGYIAHIWILRWGGLREVHRLRVMVIAQARGREPGVMRAAKRT